MKDKRLSHWAGWLSGVAVVAMLFSCGSTKAPARSYDTFQQSEFEHPGNTFRAVPFYSLNDRLDSAELVRQIGLMKEAGYGGAFLHSRIGLLTPYLGDEWFRMMDIGTRELQKQGMDAWYYDEDKWPSGFAGGIVPRANPDFRARCLVRLPLGTLVQAPDTVLLQDDSYLYVCRVNPMGQPRYNGTCWVDLMNPGTVQTFIESSYRPYAERFGRMQGVRGMFTDEPNVMARPEMSTQGVVSYSPVLDTLFRQRCGYALRPHLPSLFDTVGEWRKVRLDYYRTIAYALEQAFSKPIGDYCAQNGWIWTGHYNGEDTPGLTMLNTGNLMQQLRHMQQPGLDALGLRLNTIYSAKGVTSVANQYGRQRRLCELFGIGGHNLSFEDRMWITSWNTIMGINFMCPHLYQYSLKGERKRDYPPAISHQQPYWAQNRLFEDFSARLCYFATVGKNEAELCVIHPQESAYLETQTSIITPTGVQEPVLGALMRAHRNFDFGDEQIISETGRTSAGRFVIGEMAYRGVVVPELTTIRRSTLDRLVDFAAAGGPVFVCGEYPRFVDGEVSPEQIARLKECAMQVSPETLGAALREKVPARFELEGAGSDSVWTHLRSLRDGMAMQLSNMSRTRETTLSIRFPDLGTPAVLWNPVNGECLRLVADSKGAFRIGFAPAQTWILTTGASAEKARCSKDYRLPGERRLVKTLEGEWTQHRLTPNALTLDYARFSKDGGRTWGVSEPVLAFSDRAAQRPYNGPLQIRYAFDAATLPRSCSLVMEQPEMYTSIRVNGQEVRYAESDGSYLDRTFRTRDITSLLKKGANDIVLSLDFRAALPNSYNADERYGTEIESIYLIGDFGVQSRVAEAPLAASWRNRSPYLDRKAPVNRLSDFVLTAEPDRIDGDLTTRGYPFFAGSMELEQTFDLTGVDTSYRYFLTFPAFEATLIGIEINGTALPILFSSPWEADLTPWLKEGPNRVKLTLTNSLRNLLGPHHHKGGEFTEVRPVTFRAGPDISSTMMNEPSGEPDWYDARLRGNAALWRDSYHLIPFGLMAPPEIRRQQ